ncbi:LacI family transcriptional regulator [Marivirga lumbricoides]|uniref:LacI family transcriptional regulator n=1 Tax=Marivirga lumbricoides TaxID=1046115 RepID=A0A2T4DTB8_9BACT|nr:LacI family transcriptional regulator [Marivirga lumbricoides]GGC51362.1 LacI family transcriptional regulator [Marivirga lumbricoides]
MNKKKKITIYDLAKKINYSPSTISRALNDDKSISKKAIKIIKEAAEEMGYRRNSLAASLRNSKSNTIGIMISRINRPFIASLISGVEDYARKEGYNVIISQSDDIYENEVNNAKVLFDTRISGLIVSLAMETKDFAHFQQFVDQRIPIVFVDRVPEEFNSYRVLIDNYSAGYKATKHLIEQGCRRIAHFAGAQHRNVYKDRMKGYLDALREYNLPIDKELIVKFKTLSFEEGYKAAKKVTSLDLVPDGLFSANDTAALGAIIYAKKHQIKIPEELAIIGFNDDPMASIVDPGLSTITHPAYQMGKISAQRVLNHTDEMYDNSVSEVTILNTDLIVRESSKKKG